MIIHPLFDALSFIVFEIPDPSVELAQPPTVQPLKSIEDLESEVLSLKGEVVLLRQKVRERITMRSRLIRNASEMTVDEAVEIIPATVQGFRLPKERLDVFADAVTRFYIFRKTNFKIDS